MNTTEIIARVRQRFPGWSISVQEHENVPGKTVIWLQRPTPAQACVPDKPYTRTYIAVCELRHDFNEAVRRAKRDISGMWRGTMGVDDWMMNL